MRHETVSGHLRSDFRYGCGELRGSNAGEAHDDTSRLVRTRPVLVDELRRASTEDVAKDESDEDGVVEVPGDRDEVRNEVDRHREVGDERAEHDLPPAGDNAGL